MRISQNAQIAHTLDWSEAVRLIVTAHLIIDTCVNTFSVCRFQH